MILLQFHAVRTRTVVESVNPRIAHKFNQIPIAIIVLGQHDEVITTQVFSGFP